MIKHRVRGRRANCKATPNAPKAGGESLERNWARAGGCYDIIERGGARERTAADEADGAGPGVRRGWVDVAGGKLRSPVQIRRGVCGRRNSAWRMAEGDNTRRGERVAHGV